MIQSSFRNKLLILLLSVALIPFLTIATVFYSSSSDAAMKSSIEKLESIRNLTKNELLRYFSYQHDLAEIITEDSIVKKSFMELYELQKKSKISDNARFPFESKDVQNIYKKYDDYINWYIYKHHFSDIYFIEAESGQVIYTAMKHADIGVNLKVGDLRKSALAWAFYHAVRNRNVTFEDMYPGGEKLERPSMLMSIPVIREGSVIGVVVLRFGFDKVNEIVSSHLGDRKGEGLYLVGEDYRLRSNSSFGPVSMTVEQSFANVQKGKIESLSVQNGQKGRESSEMIILGAQGEKVISSYTPVYLYGTTWVLLSEIAAKTLDHSSQSLLWMIVLFTIILIAIITGGTRYIQERLKQTYDRRINGIALKSSGIESHTDSMELTLTLLSQRSDDQSALTEDLTRRLEYTLSSEKKSRDFFKAIRTLGGRANELIVESENKIEKSLWQLNQVGEATHDLKVLIERMNEISLQTNLVALSADSSVQEREEEGSRLSAIADRTKILSKQMEQISKDTQSFMDDVILHMDEGRLINRNMGDLLETLNKNSEKSNHLLKLFQQSYQKNLQNYQNVLVAMSGANMLNSENALASKEILSEIVELHSLSAVMYDDIAAIASAMGVELREPQTNADAFAARGELPRNRQSQQHLTLREESIANELAKL